MLYQQLSLKLHTRTKLFSKSRRKITTPSLSNNRFVRGSSDLERGRWHIVLVIPIFFLLVIPITWKAQWEGWSSGSVSTFSSLAYSALTAVAKTQHRRMKWRMKRKASV